MPFASDTLELAREPELNPFATLAALGGKGKKWFVLSEYY